MINVKTHNGITHVELKGSAVLVTAEICETIKSYCAHCAKREGLPFGKALASTLTLINVALGGNHES